MPLSDNFQEFIRGWTSKAERILLHDHDIATYFDKFFTLFVIYNRLYAEATYQMWRDRTINPRNDDDRFPDSDAAKDYVARFLRAPTMLRSLESEPRSRAAISDMERILDEGYFFILLRGPEAEGDRDADLELLRRLRSHRPRERARAVLEFIHAIRCNTFHGSKNFDRVQLDVLKPCIEVMAHLNRLLLEKLTQPDA